jgi:hypothetical protein
MSHQPAGICKILVSGLGSPVKVRIFMLLARSRDALMRYAIDKDAWVSDQDTVKALRIFVEIGCIKGIPYRPVKD